MASIQTRKNVFALGVVLLAKEGSKVLFALSGLAIKLNMELLSMIPTLLGIVLIVLGVSAAAYLFRHLAPEWRLFIEDMFVIEEVNKEEEKKEE